MRWQIVLIVTGVFGTGLGVAGEPDTSPRPYPMPTVEDHARAGFPRCISKLARPTVTQHYAGGYVGGGCLFHGEGRRAGTDGTFGFDYVLCGKFPGRIFLGWCHCRDHQPKAGKYETTGPEVVDIFAIKPLQHAVHRHREARSHGEGEGGH